MLAVVRSCAVVGLDGIIVAVETDFNPRAQVPVFTIVGLPGSAVKESRERVRSAIKNSGLQFPAKGYVVNLSPADLPKQGPAYDLAIAVGVLAATDQIPLKVLEKSVFIGELSLNGNIRHVKGVMPAAYAAAQEGIETIYVPEADAPEAALIPEIEVIPVPSLGHLVEHLYRLNPIPPYKLDGIQFQPLDPAEEGLVDFASIKGNEHVKRAIEIGASGNHNVLMTGSPGVGKSLIARAMPGILPRLTMEEALEVTRIYSVADMLHSDQPLVTQRPFRAPHHTISQAGLVGGGSNPKPGEISLAHRGVLFLDEVVEHSIKTLEVLRQPIEDKTVTISRANGTITFPANFLLVAARNPCPCGYYGDPVHSCTCSPTMISRYQAKLSGPMMDRIDIHIQVPRVDYDKLMSTDTGESSSSVRERVEMARGRQIKRFKGHMGIFANADMLPGDVQSMCVMNTDTRQLLELSVRRLHLSARAYHRVLKLARTIADLDDCDTIQTHHVAEALQYRPEQGA